MNVYRFKALSPTGKYFKGNLECLNEEELTKILLEHDLRLKKYKLVKEKKFKLTLDRVGDKDILNLCEKLKMINKTAIPLDQAFFIISKNATNVQFKNALNSVSIDLHKGISLSKALEKYPKVFPKYFITMIALSESGGNLDLILDELIKYYEFKINSFKKIISSIMYPSFLFFIALLVFGVTLFYIIPTFEGIFQEMKVDLNILTKFIIALSHFVKNNLLFIILFILLFIFLIILFLRGKKGKYFLNKFRYNYSIFKRLHVARLIINFTSSLKLLISNGVPVIQSIESTLNLLADGYLAGKLGFAVAEIKRGQPLSKALNSINLFPQFFIQTLEISDISGDIIYSLAILNKIYQDEESNTIKRLMAFVEPLFILMIAGVLVLIIVAIFVPLFSMLNNIGV